MGPWEIVVAILGAVTIITAGVVKIFSSYGPKKLSEGSGPKALSSSSVRDIERLARLEEQVKGHSRELGEVKGRIDGLSGKVTKLGDLVIEWIKGGNGRRKS